MHGAGGGAPKGNRNAWKHGEAGEGAFVLRKQIQALTVLVRKAMWKI